MIHQAHIRHIKEQGDLSTTWSHGAASPSTQSLGPRALETFTLEMKLDATTTFEWQWHTQEHTDMTKSSSTSLTYMPKLPRPQRTKKCPAREPNKTNKQVTALPLMPHPQTAFAYRARVKCTLSIYAPSSGLRCMLKRSTCWKQTTIAWIVCVFVKKCRFLNNCKHCQRPHHTLDSRCHICPKCNPNSFTTQFDSNSC